MKERERLPASSHFVLGEAFYTTEYHAELQVFNYFNAMHMAFQDYDRYINCSKSAYWFCFQYLKNLRSTFTRPGVEDTFAEPSCYNEVLPGVSFLPSRHNSIVEDMKAKLNDVVLNTIHEALLDNVKQFPEHCQSTDTWMNHTGYHLPLECRKRIPRA